MVASVNMTNLRMALHYSYPGLGFKHREFSNGIAKLLKAALQLSSDADSADGAPSWVVVKAFLWTAWQRALMLGFWIFLRAQLQTGYSYENNKLLTTHGVAWFPEMFAQCTVQQLDDRKKTPYMCGWAYDLLQTDRACVAMDFRRFHQCYGLLFGDRPARCKDAHQQCDGRSPEDCQRFKGAIVLDQSAHDWKCQMDCKRLYWDRFSFLNVSGAKAVCLDSTDDRYLRYRKASNKTLAISHVWSHGQGGRPDSTGFNACLQRRYADLARSFGCDSYWMDTPCIPTEKRLRSECIGHINQIFAESRVTLMCDRDLMSIDISNLTIGLRESILATVLVCDWNIRAWTLLEAMRGRRNIHLLCKSNEVISFKETLQIVHENGRIDLAILFLTSQHLLPHDSERDFELFDGMGSVATEEDLRIAQGFLSVGEAAVLLSHRHATRDGDDIVIWSLLAHEKAIKDPVQLWTSQLGAKVETGFLLSSMPRIQGTKGLGWAPCCPTLRPLQGKGTDGTAGKFYLAYEGMDTRSGVVTSEGLRARWLVHRFSPCPADCAALLPGLDDAASQRLQRYGCGALLQPCALPGPANVPAQYRGNSQGPLYAICGSNDGRCWAWIGVYDWGTRDDKPDFKFQDLLLI